MDHSAIHTGLLPYPYTSNLKCPSIARSISCCWIPMYLCVTAAELCCKSFAPPVNLPSNPSVHEVVLLDRLRQYSNEANHFLLFRLQSKVFGSSIFRRNNLAQGSDVIIYQIICSQSTCLPAASAASHSFRLAVLKVPKDGRVHTTFSQCSSTPKARLKVASEIGS